MRDTLYVQYGAGWSAPEGWVSFDSSPTLWLERLPVVGRLVRVNSQRFPEATRFGDIVKGLPVADGSARAVYASHVLEHLSRNDVEIALANTLRILEPGGVFRLIVPDLQARARRYLVRAEANDTGAADDFMMETMLGLRARPRTLLGRLRSLIGNSDHLWMYDEAAMCALMEKVGFAGVRRCDLGDASEAAFSRVEAADRFKDMSLGCREVAIEGRRAD